MARKLAKDCWTQGMAPHSGQTLDEGWLPAGTLVRRVWTDATEDGTRYTFEASTDGGEHWYKQCTYQEPVLAGEG